MSGTPAPGGAHGYFAGIHAQPHALSVLTSALDHGRVASSYLFEGPAGVGKQLAALALAKSQLTRLGAGPATMERVASGNHPDVRVFEPRDEGKGNVQVAYLREEILPLAQYAPFEAQATFFIFPRADVSFPETHPGAANALLKTLEEPRPAVHFILLAERPDKLLSTIRSRCQRVRFYPLPYEELDAILAKHDVAESLRGPAIALAGGSAERALRLTEEGVAERLLQLAFQVDDVTRGARVGDYVDAAAALAAEPDVQLGLDTLVAFYRDLAASALGARREELAFRHVAEEIEARGRTLGARKAAARVAAITSVFEGLDRNANPRVTMDALVYELRHAH
ncbi:MAG: AAA family ATPase [Myxococcales bacterium]|nr:AAA family ATPase [Myxococcales bacterium]MCB9630444.1 AAA family ATPase [Sandaracinaceae bacterium]